jgi:hypothetical protein
MGRSLRPSSFSFARTFGEISSMKDQEGYGAENAEVSVLGWILQCYFSLPFLDLLAILLL